MAKKKNILIVSAHPDDEVLGCGGTMIKFSKKYNIYSIIAGEGLTSRTKSNKKKLKKGLDLLKKQAFKAAKIMGVKKTFLLSLPDNKLDSIPLLSIIHKLEKIIDKIKPEIIYTHHQGDLNIDHQIINKAVLTATRPIGNKYLKSIRTFEVLSSTEWGNKNSNKTSFNPNLFIDIYKELDKKIKSFLCYKSEVRKFPHPRSKEGIQNLAKFRGSSSGLKAAEAFQIIRSVYK